MGRQTSPLTPNTRCSGEKKTIKRAGHADNLHAEIIARGGMGAAGVGLLVEAGVGGLFRVRDLVPGQPASRSALQVGDELQRIDGRDLLGMTLSQVCSLLTGSPGSSVSITARSAATRHKYVCKLVRQAAPKPSGPISKPQATAKAQGSASPAIASPSPSKEPCKFGAGPRLAWHADFREAPREHDRNAEEEPARRDSSGAACALAQTNERLKAELLRTRQELVGAQEQQQAVELVKGQHDNAIALLKARVAELGEQLEFEKRRGSKWKAAALALPRLEEEFHSLSLSFRMSQVEFTRNLNNLVQQEQELRGILHHRLEHEQATVDSMVAVERKRLNEARIEYEGMQHQIEHLNRSMQLEIARQQESHEAAMSRAAHNSSDQEARFKAMHADQQAKFKEQEENVRLMHSREIEALRTQNTDAHRQASAAEVALQAAREQIENARQQQQELRTEQARVINELHAAHSQVVQDLIKNYKDQMFRVEQEFSDRSSSAHLEQSSVLQETEQRAHALADEIEELRHDKEACVKALREEMEHTKSREMQALQRDHEASVEALQKELEKQRADADGVRRVLQECRTELAVKEEVAKRGSGESEKLLQAAADDAEKLELSLSLASRNIRELAADRNRCKAETAAVLSSANEVLMKTQDLEHELSKRKDLEAQLESLSAREKDTALQSKSDIQALTAKQAEIIQTLVARAENEKQALRAEMQKEVEGCKVVARQETESLQAVLQEQMETMKRAHDQTLQNLQQMEHLNRSMQLEIACQQESHEAAMSRAAHNSSDQEARFKAMHADQQAKFKEQEENVRLMHSREIEALRTQNTDAHRQASAAEVALQAAREQIENARQQQQELRTEQARVINELHAAHSQVVQDLIKNYKDQMFRVEQEFSDRSSSAHLEQSSVLQETEQRAHALADEIEELRHDKEACVKALREEMEHTKSREMQALQRDHEASVEALQKELEKQRADADGVRRVLQECRTELAVKEEVAKRGSGESEKLLQAAADDAEKLELSLSLASRNIRELAADRNRCKAETAAVLSSANEVLMKTQDLEHELSKRKDLEAQLESLSAREKDTALQSKSDIQALTAKQAEIIQTLVARAENEKQALRAEMQKEVEGILRNSRDLSCEIAMAIDSQREAERCFHVAFTLELRTLVSWVQSTQADVTNLMDALASEPAPQVLHLQSDFEMDESFSPGVLERHMEDRLAELEHSFHLRTFDRDQQQKHSDGLANELTRLCTENLALQTAITTQKQQLHAKDKIIMVLQQVVKDTNGSATKLSEELRLLQDEVVHLKQSYATELDGLEREHLPQVRLAGGVAVEVSTSSQNISVSASRTTPTHIELSPSSLHGLCDNMPAPSRSPPTLSPDVSFFQRLRDPSSWDGNRTIPTAQPLLQSPVFGIYPPSRRSPSAFLSSKQDGIHNDGQERSPVEGTPANRQIFSETFSELYRSIELRRENQRLRAALEQSRSLPQTSRISQGETCQVARVLPDFLQTQIHGSILDRRLLLPVDDSSSHTNLCRELEQSNKARDELLDTIQLQSDEILQLQQRFKSLLPPEITLQTRKPEYEIKASYDLANMQKALGSARKELEQSLIARNDLLR
jgi:hypothetical protein